MTGLVTLIFSVGGARSSTFLVGGVLAVDAVLVGCVVVVVVVGWAVGVLADVGGLVAVALLAVVVFEPLLPQPASSPSVTAASAAAVPLAPRLCGDWLVCPLPIGAYQ
jgi:hypothetical protein